MYKLYRRENQSNSSHRTLADNTEISYVDITINMVLNTIKKINASKSQGPHEMHPRIINKRMLLNNQNIFAAYLENI